MNKTVNILGIRGVPAAHGGFETFAHHLSLYLVERGWTVNVYCQDDKGVHEDGARDSWNGVNRIFFTTKRSGPIGTMEFDYKCVRHVLDKPGVDLVLGYNTAVFNLLERLKGRKIAMNMDGIEWKRAKWSRPAKIWFFFNEIMGANLCHIPIADHPEICAHVSKRCLKKPVVIAYGSDSIHDAPTQPVLDLGLGIEPDRYFVSIARIEPENSILEIVRAFSSIDTDTKCVILGKLDDNNAYQREVKAAAGQNVVFPGAIYDQAVVSSLRYHARAYLHGHQVGGTNPSLVEALGAGNAVIAHSNKFNRWVAGPAQSYFQDEDTLIRGMRMIIRDDDKVALSRSAAREQHETRFQWHMILSQYEKTLLRLVP